jgi:hypothetical protein
MNYGMHNIKQGKLPPLHKHVDLFLRNKKRRFESGRDESPFISFDDLVTRISERRKPDLTPEFRAKDVNSTYMSLVGTRPGRPRHGDHPCQISWMYVQDLVSKEKGFVLRNKFLSKLFKDLKPDYGSPEKAKARSRGFQVFFSLGIRDPRILTLGGEEGYCVDEMLKKCPGPDAEILSIDDSMRTLEKFSKKFAKFPNVKTIFSDLDKFVNSDSLDFDFLNLDAMGYMSGEISDRLFNINCKTTRAKVITLTVEASKLLRNHGSYVRRIRASCPQPADGSKPDEVRYGLESVIPAYKIVDDFTYRSNQDDMRIFVLLRKD